MEIHTTGGISGPDPIQPNRINSARIRSTNHTTKATDHAEISEHARFLAALRETPPVRKDKVDALRAMIASGKYETPERIAGAVNNLLEELG
jgi:flagellar biosynthesis anti-sigma factor FlgM